MFIPNYVFTSRAHLYILYIYRFTKKVVQRLIHIQLHSTIPIYEQIVEQFKIQIANGTLAPHTPLPSIRALAKELKISVITTKRAYAELEQLGLIQTIPGKGSFVADSPNVVHEHIAQQIEFHLEQAIHLSKQLQRNKQDIIQLIDLFWEES